MMQLVCRRIVQRRYQIQIWQNTPLYARALATTATNERPVISREASIPLKRHWGLPSKFVAEETEVHALEISRSDCETVKAVRLDMRQLLEKFSIHARDISSLRRQTALIQPRSECILVSMSHVRAIVGPDVALLLDSQRPSVQDFAHGLSQYLPYFQHESNDDVDNKNNDDDGTADTAAFEMQVIEAILSAVAAKYSRRVSLYGPIVHKMLSDVRSEMQYGHHMAIERLLPLTNSLGKFERSNDSVIRAIDDLLQRDEDMARMQLTKAREGDGVLDLELHHSVEIILDSYMRRFQDYYEEGFLLRKKIKATQDLMELDLGRYRNHLIRMNLRMAVATVGLAMATTIYGMFGMNLLSGLETSPGLFAGVSGGAAIAGFTVYGAVMHSARESSKVQRDSIRILNELETLTFSNRLDDVQDIVLSALEDNNLSALDKAQFHSIMQSACGRQMDEAELDIIFNAFDKNRDGILDIEDVMVYVVEQHGV